MTSDGRRVRRLEDERLLRGLGRFADDVNRVGALHLRVVRAQVAHARILSIDTGQARALPGVTAVITGEDVKDVAPIPVRLNVGGHDLSAFLQPMLAREKVRYVGEPVAAVVAEDPYVAEDAAELVEVSYDDLCAVLDGETALRETLGETALGETAAREAAVPLHEAGHVAAVLDLGYGDCAAAFAAADTVVALTLDVGRHSAVPMEPRGLLADYDAGTGRLEIWGATKVPVFNRRVLASMLGLPEHRIRLRAMDAGGGFGPRGEFYPEDFLVPWLARRLGRPVKWTEDRAEHLVAVNHSRQQRHRIEAAFAADGTLLGLRDDVIHDNGAYMRTHGVLVPELTLAMLPGPYRLPAYAGRARVVLTNKTPCGTYRAPGRFEGTFAREHLFDVAADRLGIDRVELRRRNLLRPEEIPHTRPLNTIGTDVVLDAGDYPKLLDRALAHTAGWPEEVATLRAEGRLAGVGLAVFLEKSGLGPHDTADVLVGPDGTVRVHSGGTSLGQGIETVLAQIAAEPLGVDPREVEVVNGDTELQPFGGGSWASRSTVVSGSAVRLAAEAVAVRALRVAARVLGVPESGLRLTGGAVTGPDVRLTLGEVAAACAPGSPHLAADEPAGLSARRTFEVEHMTYPYGVHVALAEVDQGTGGVRVRRYLVAYEVGRAINPTLVEGQLVGGVAQGIGGSLMEEFRYDDNGQPLAATFMDYLVPTAAETPRVETIVTEDAPSPGNPLGVKGAGEGGLSAAGGAIANAVRDALGLRGGVGALPLSASRVIELLSADDS
ncbi:xanthine dehydrogenase family protein molybdopterin-binding subunit [Nonomuraea sp. 10N515B]|uniref:xanthine dehydrogenase family protein molybdopterin-binding subunit n=1 Tax=Nonomuraea sp. 10N515B TaxID=3457422 RepID=UPI003FCC7072